MLLSTSDCVIIAFTLTTVAFPVETLELPGIFSQTICANNTLNSSLHLRPVCECMNEYGTTNLETLCR